MLSNNEFTYFQPQRYNDDGTNIGWDTPDGLFSFQAFLSEDDCIAWLENNGYNPDDFTIHEYHDNDSEGVTLLYPDGSVITRIEDLSDEEIADLLTDEVLFAASSIDNLHATRQDDETQQEYKDRVYEEALDYVNDAIVDIEEHGEYNFQAYCGTPDVEWYDEARDEAVRTVMNWMLEDYPY
jgi:hypothetical protein